MQLVHPVLPSSVCPQPLAVLLPSRALELTLPQGKEIFTNVCVCLVPWLCCRQWAQEGWNGANLSIGITPVGWEGWATPRAWLGHTHTHSHSLQLGTCSLAADSLWDGIWAQPWTGMCKHLHGNFSLRRCDRWDGGLGWTTLPRVTHWHSGLGARACELCTFKEI